MRTHWLLCPITAALTLALQPPNVLAAQQPKTEPLAGWLGVFPELQGYQRSFAAPVVTEKKTAYQQTAKYEWTGGRIETLQITLARDPAFKDKYAAPTLAKEKPAPKEARVGKRTAWLWTGADGTERRLVVPLTAERAVIVEGTGMVQSLIDVAGKLDLPRVEAALENAPRTDFRRSLEAFRMLKKGASFADVVAWVGLNADKAEKDKAGNDVLVYRLSDGSRVLLGFTAGFKSLSYASHEGKDGKAEDLLK